MAIMTRRGVLLGAGAAMLASALPPGARAQQADRIAIQLYTVRQLCERDLEATLAALAEMGFRAVQSSSTYGRDPAAFRRALDVSGLVAPSGHLNIPQPFDAEVWSRALADAATIGNATLVHSFFGRNLLGPIRDRAIWSAFVADLNQAARMAREAGRALEYHNHDAEFAPLDDGSGETGFNVLLAETDPALLRFEVDLYWLWAGAADPWAVLDRALPRIGRYHVKDRAADGAFADIGSGTIDFARVFARGPVEQYIVERDDAGTFPRRPEDALETARVGRAALRELLA